MNFDLDSKAETHTISKVNEDTGGKSVDFQALLVEEDRLIQEAAKIIERNNFLNDIKTAKRLDSLRRKIIAVHKKIAKHPFYHHTGGGEHLH